MSKNIHTYIHTYKCTYINTCSATPDAGRQTDRHTHTDRQIKLAAGYIRVLLLTGIQIYTGIHMNTGELLKYTFKSTIIMMKKKTVFDAFILLHVYRHLRVRMRKIR